MLITYTYLLYRWSSGRYVYIFMIYHGVYGFRIDEEEGKEVGVREMGFG
jgi:hypothetical protein